MTTIRAIGSTLIVSMTDLDRVDATTVTCPGMGTVTVQASQIDPSTGLCLGEDRHPHDGIIVGMGPRCADTDLTIGTRVMVVADLGSRWEHEGMMLQHVRTLTPCQCGRDVPTDAVFCRIGRDGYRAPQGRVIVRPEQTAPSTTVSMVGATESIEWGTIYDTGQWVHAGLRPGTRVAYRSAAGIRWDGPGGEYISLRARPVGCRCGASRDELLAIAP